MQVTQCPQCGGPAASSDRMCSWCKAEFFVTSLAYLGNFDQNGLSKYLNYYNEIIRQYPDSIEGMLGLGLCYLQLGNYPLAQKCFGRIVEVSPDVSQAYYYYALSNIKGRRIMTLSLNEARIIDTFLNTAIQLDGGKPQYKLLLAMLKRDYYETNGLKVPPPIASELLRDIEDSEISKNEIDRLIEAVKVANQQFYFSNLTIV